MSRPGEVGQDHDGRVSTRKVLLGNRAEAYLRMDPPLHDKAEADANAVLQVSTAAVSVSVAAGCRRSCLAVISSRTD